MPPDALETRQPDAPAAPLRCLLLVPSLHRAGAETQTVELANGLAARGHSVHLCCFEKKLDLRERLSDAVRFHHVPRKSKFDTSLPERLARLIDAEGIGVVQGVLQFATLLAWLAARRSNAKPAVVAAVHTTRNRDLKQEIQERLVYSRVMRKLQALVFVCDHQKSHWVRKYPALQHLSTVVHNGLDPQRFRQVDFAESGRQLRAALNIAPEQVVFACVAAFRPEKGHRTLLDAFSRAGGESCLVFAGDGPLRASAEALASEYGLEDRTRFLGNIPDTRPLIAASTATVLASDFETFSMAMLESMAMGVPMIAPRIGGLPEAIVHEETGLLFPPGDIPMLADLLRRIALSPAEAARMGGLAQDKVQENFTFAGMVAGSERVLSEAMLKRASLRAGG
jgi:glycosyltransferase involved in cell wall biosynthesis